VHAPHGILHAAGFADVSDQELDLVALERDPHVFLLLLIPAEDPDLGKV
jgi:hypothetical protein